MANKRKQNESIKSTSRIAPKMHSKTSPKAAPVPGEAAGSIDEYCDSQFHKDLSKAREPIQKMAEEALESLREGKARKFPE